MKSAPAMMPMVFCASLAPCKRLKAAADTSCILRKNLSTRRGAGFRSTQWLIAISSRPTNMPDQRRHDDEDQRARPPLDMIAMKPAFAIAAPA